MAGKFLGNPNQGSIKQGKEKLDASVSVCLECRPFLISQIFTSAIQIFHIYKSVDGINPN